MAICTADRQDSPRRARYAVRALACALLAAAGLLAPPPLHAGTYTTTIQSRAITTDTYLKQENATENRGSDPDMRVKRSTGGKTKNAVVSIPLPDMTGKSILQAWLSLYQSAANSGSMSVTSHALTQSWTESGASWTNRFSGAPWTTAGGTRLSAWTSRRVISDQTNLSRTSWQVGPIVNAWNLGTLANNGFLLTAETGQDLEMQFRTSEFTTDTTKTPQLILQYTDEPPAIRSGTAEIQPYRVVKGITNLPWTVWLDVAASGSTPSGAATGFDLITIDHEGALRGRTLDSLFVGGTPVPLDQVVWYDNGKSITLRLPRVTIVGTVRAAFHVDVLATQAAEIPVYVDDTATSGCYAQVLWPGNADGLAGNGDTWLLDPSLAVVSVALEPDTLDTVVGLCTQFTLIATDGAGNQYPVQADSFTTYNTAAGKPDPSIGTVDATGYFCARKSGNNFALIAWYANATNGPGYAYAPLHIQPALLPTITSVTLRNRSGTSTTTIVPQDTMFVDVTLGDGNGFKDITGADLVLSFNGHASDANAPAYRAAYRWRRGAPAPFTVVDPAASSWGVLPALCSVDTTTNSTSAQTLRFAFRPGVIARASSAGEWTARVNAISATPVDSSAALSKTGLNAAVRLTAAWDDSAGSFNAGSPGATLLPLRDPADGKVDLHILANAAYDLQAAARDLVGTTSASDTLRAGPPARPISWALNSGRTGGGRLDTAYVALATARPAATAEAPTPENLYLWIDLPSTVPPQDYRGAVRIRLAAAGVRSAEPSIPLTATVTTSGQAAQSVVGEVLPDTVAVGVSAQAFTAYVLPTFNLFDTGIDRIRVSIPDGYGVPSITSVKVGGSGVAYTDASQSGVMEAQLASHVAYSLFSRLIEIRFQVSTPVDLDSTGSNFVVQYDDDATTRPPEVATEGNANGVADGNDWRVIVVPGPVASVGVTPDSASLYVGETQSFRAAAFDAFGHPVARSFAWSTQGGIGAVDGTGLFTASAVGSGLVIATAGALSATAPVTVRPTRGIRIAGLTAPSALYQGQDSVAVRLTLTNLGADSIRLDPPALRFTRLIPGDADGDFDVALASGSPAGIGPRGTVVVTALARVLTAASTGTVSIDASASAIEIVSDIEVQDPAADAPVVALITSGGISVTAAQVPSSVLPGARNVVLANLTVTNHYPDTRTVRSLRLTNRSVGLGDQDQLDDELGETALYKDDGDGALESGADTLLVATSALSGSVTFAPLAMTLAPGSTARLLVTSSIPLDARDGDSLDVSLDDSTSVTFVRVPFFRTGWPLRPPGVFAVDGMAADQIRLMPGAGGNLLAGSSNNPTLEFIVPPNGYRPDLLQKLAVVNFGTAEAANDITRLRAWVDDGDSTFDASRDRLLGDLVNTGDRWQRTGLAETIPLGGLCLFVTVDLSDLARQGRTVQLGIPFGLDAGIGVQSGNSGPRDRAVRSLVERAVSTVDRVTLTAADVESTVVHPGDRRVLLHHFVITNSYADPRTLTSVAFTNATLGPGGTAARDGEIESATLRLDGDGDGLLGDPAVDRPLGTSFFSGGRAAFTGLSAPIPAGAAVHLFLVADVARSGARDGDVLAAKVAGPLDVGFKEPTTTTAAWPIDSRARATVDGLMAAQITNIGAAGVTIGPGDGPVLALNVVVPWNGYETDTLRNVAVVNLGSATPATGLQELRLWRDGGDGIFSAGGGDDVDLGAMLPDSSAQVWRSPFLSEAVEGAGRRLFVSLGTSATARDSVTVRLAIPFGGIQMETGDDGPLDARVENEQAILISTSPLLATLETATAASTVGQPITVRMIVRNVGAETVTGILPGPLRTSGTAGTVLDAAPGSPVDLAPAAVDTFLWTYHSTSAGDVRFQGGAEGTGAETGLIRRAVETPSNVHRVYLAAAELALFPVQSMPFNVTRGQTGVVPFSLTLTNGGGSGASDIRLRSFRLHLQDETGAGIVPAALLSHVSVNEGTNVYLSRSSLETTGSELNLTLASPLRITAQEPVTLSIRVDIADSTTVPAFRVLLADSTEILAEDATSGAPVTVRHEGGSFPVASGLARLAADATELSVASLGGAASRVAIGTTGVPLATFRLGNVGVAGITSDVQVNRIGVTVADTAGVPLAQAASYLSRIVVRAGFQTFATQPVPAGAGPGVTLVLSPPLAVPAGTPVDLFLDGDVPDSARVGAFRLILQPPSSFEAQDANSRDSVSVRYTGAPWGVAVLVEAPARFVAARGTALFPASAVAGERDLAALRVVLRHPGSPGTGRVRADSLLVQVRDETRTARVPDLFLDRLRLFQDGVEVLNVTSFPVAAVPVAVPLTGPLLEPGDSAAFTLVADLSPSAPASFLELAIAGSGILASDANSGQPVIAAPEPGVDFPLVSGLTHIASPARDLMARLVDRMPAALAVDGREVVTGVLTLRNAASAGSGSIRVDRLRVRACDPAFRALAVGAAARRVAAYVNGTPWAESDSLSADSTEATLSAAAPLDVDAGRTVSVELRLVPQPAPSAASFRIGIDAAGVGVVQPGSALLTVQVSPEAGTAFPMWTESGSFTPASLAASWGNFPNPFAAGREATSFVYYLASSADVTLRIWTPAGEGVATLLDRAPRGAGLHQADAWNGRNGRGDVVRNGVYVAELIVKYADGSTERARRKVAVVR
ncbi:MAG TPA: DNRLRE domain-containing protein [Candidatus Omnitrophota bacterium]|nr:DNRLRE domain-containing protein [Candidatus Omnitrophota bacterium]